MSTSSPEHPMHSVRSVDELAARLERRKRMTAKERKADNEQFKAQRDALRMFWKARGPIAPLTCMACRLELTTVAAMDRHGKQAGHRHYQLALLIAPPDGP